MNVSPRRVLLTVSLLHGASHLYTTFLQPLNSDLRDFFGLKLDQQITLIPAVYFICYAASNLASGLLVTRLSPRTLLAFGPILNGLSILCMYFLQPQHYTWLLILNGLGALGGGLYHPAGNYLLTETFPHERGKALGYSGVGAAIAFILSPWIASQLVHRDICSWQTVCLAYGVLGILVGISALFLLPAVQCSKAASASSTNAAEDASVKRAVLLFAGVMVLITAGREIASWGVTSITQQFAAATYPEHVDSGLLIALIFAPGLIVQPLAGRWSDIVGRERVIGAAFLCAAIALFLLPLAPRSLIYIPYLLFGAAAMATVPTTDALIADRAPPHLRGLAFGIVITAAFGSGSMGPLLAGAVADAGHRSAESYRWAFWALSAAAFSSFLACFLAGPAARRLNVTKYGQAPEQSAVASV